MLELNKGDNVVLTHPHLRDVYCVACIREQPTAKTISISYYGRQSVGTPTFAMKEDTVERRNRTAVIAVIDPALDPLEIAAQVRRANELLFARNLRVEKRQVSLVKGLASGEIKHGDSLERRSHELIEWMDTGLLRPDGYIVAMGNRRHPADPNRYQMAERETVREALELLSQPYEAVAKMDEKLFIA